MASLEDTYQVVEKISKEQQILMNLLYEEVEISIDEGNSPFAAIITDSQNNMISKTHNQANSKNITIAHAEIEAIQMACNKLKKKKLNNCIIYVNAESCAMCATAIIKSGIAKVYYGAPHEQVSNPSIYLREINEKASPKLEVYGGIMAEKFSEQIQRGRKHLERGKL